MNLRVFKTLLLLVYVFLYSSTGNAELVGGHERQRLSQLFLASLKEYFQSAPIQLNLAEFPVTLTESEIRKLNLYTVLQEEGLLNGRFFSGTTASAPDVVQRLVEFELTKKAEQLGIVLGSIVTQRLLIIDAIPTDELKPAQYEVTFQWQLAEPEPWLWAPILQSDADIRLLLQSRERAQSGVARFSQVEFGWSLDFVDLTSSSNSLF